MWPSKPYSAGACQAAATTEHRSTALIRRGRPERCASLRPSRPWAATRRHHLRTVAGLQFIALALVHLIVAEPEVFGTHGGVPLG